MSKHILDVGQCGFDGPRLRRMLQDKLDATVDTANTLDEALIKAAATDYALVLVNRILNADGSAGLAVIAAIRAEHPECKVMLVSDLPAAQAEAQRLGALPGFGKAALSATATEDLLRRALA